MKQIPLFSLLIVLLIGSSAQGQILKTTNLNLNTGGVIHDVAYDSYYDAYIVVGNFTSINGQPRNSLAFIDANTYAVMPQAPITNVNGIIRSVEVVNFVPHTNVTLGNGHRDYIYLGGDFTIINSQSKNQIARLWATHYYSQFPNGGLTNYSNNTAWNAQLYWDNTLGTEIGVHDFHLMGDTLIAVGEIANVGASYLLGDYQRKTLAIDADNATFLTKNLNFLNGAVDFPFTGNEPLQGIEQLDDRLFLYGEANGLELINEYQLNGTFVQQIVSCSPNNRAVLDFEPHPSSVDTVLFAYEGFSYLSSLYYITSYLNSGSVWNCPNVSPTNTILNFPAMVQVSYIESYKDYIINTSNNGLYVSKRNGTANVPISNSFTLNSNWFTTSYPSVSSAPCLEVFKNRLFLSSNALTSVSGTSRVGLAVFCLEPSDAKPYTSFDATACEGDSSIYTTPQVDYADGYRWTYSGTGASYRVAGTGNAWTPLSNVHLSGTGANSIEMYFPSGSTGGTLTVEPFSVCNTTTDYQYSVGHSDVITVNANPDIILAPTHTLNCYADTIHVVAQSSMAGVDYSWTFYGLGIAIENDSVTVAQGLNLSDSAYYIVTVENPITGCFSMDSTYFTTDLVAALINTSAVTTDPLEWTCITDSMTISSNLAAATVTWETPSQIGTFHPDPYVITAIPNGNLTMYATYLSNGCSTQADWNGIIQDTIKATGTLIGYPLTGGIPIDTLTCANPALSIECDVTPAFSANSTAQWIVGGVPTGSDMLNLTQANVVGNNPLAFQFRTTNNDNGCTKSYNVVVAHDFDVPYVFSLADQSINCSQSEVVLSHLVNGNPSVVEGWLDVTGTQTGVDTIVAVLGDYYYHALDTDNGCTNADTVSVTQTLDLLIQMPVDTLICPDQVVSISPTVIGNSETPSYLWSTGSTNATETATGGIDGQLVVTVSTPSGCSGTDSTMILITSPVDATITAFAGCTDGSLEVTGITGGAGNYQYAIDGSVWQSSTNFSGLVFDTFTISVLDDLGCVYDFEHTLDGTALSIELFFAASTYNQEGDTIVLVNITDFTGLDSIGWGLPANADVFYQDDSTVILSIESGGWYDIDMYGYIGTDCIYTYTKSVYFGVQAPVFDSVYVSNGIQLFNVSPNPTTGQFDVNLEFGTAQNYSIVISNSLGQPIAGMGVNATGTIVSHSFQFPSGTPAGAYRIFVIADYDAKQKMIILN